MTPETLTLFCDPQNGKPLQLLKSPDGTVQFTEPQSGNTYPVRAGIPDFIRQTVDGRNRRYQFMYNRLSPLYDFVTNAAIVLMGASEENVRREYLGELEIKPGDMVLEVGVGTGANLRYLPAYARYIGLDISQGQIRQCRKTIKKMGLDALLVLGEAEKLPFPDNTFDCVFHMGGINFFNDPGAAVREMYRVAKPGVKIVIVDETDRFTKKLAKIPMVRSFFASPEDVVVPACFEPDGATEKEVTELFDGRLWLLSFRKREAGSKPAAARTDIGKANI